MDLGFHNRQCDLIAAVDSDKIALETFARNISPEAHCLDVTSSDFDSLLASMPHCDIVLGGFPCQGFSKAGPKKAADPRNLLYTRMVDAVRTLRPTIFVAENVDGLSQNYAGEFLKKIVSDFSSLGYRVSHDVLDAAQFGVPQHRRRVFFVG
ncbi:MAG: DNA cytosine methyltransferase, partial [Aestuariivirga sp.]